MEQEVKKLYPITIKVKPYCGLNDEIFEGKKTIINIYETYLDYKIDYKEKVKFTKCDDPHCNECSDMPEEAISFNKQEGFIELKDVYTTTKYVKTDYTDELEPFAIHMLDIELSNSKGILTISAEDEKDLTKLQNILKEWKLKLEIKQ